MSLTPRLLALVLFPVVAITAWASTPAHPEPETDPVVEAVASGLDAAATNVAHDADAGAPAQQALEVPSRESDPPLATAQPLPKDADVLARARLSEGRLVVGQGETRRALTVIPALQSQLTSILQRYETPFAAVVVMDPQTGRVLAMAEHAQDAPQLRGLPVKAVFPAASIFKVVTAAALLDAGVRPEDEECSHGGKRRVTLKHLKDSERDGACYSLSAALAHSANAVFAKMTVRHLTPTSLRKWAELFYFNRPIPFAIPTEMSLAAVPEDELGLARTGAGFGDVYLSPLHGAALAAVGARGGTWITPVLYEDEVSADAQAPRVLSEAQARQLSEMLEETVKRGTARRIFRERGYRVPGAVGKTGSLADRTPFRDYSWFVGFAPKENPRVAVAAVIVNGYHWRIRATWLGREAMRLGLSALPEAAPEGTSVAQDAP